MFSLSGWGLELSSNRLEVTESKHIPEACHSTVTTLRVGIIGTGNIGCDILLKLLRAKFVSVEIFCGRRAESPGLLMAAEKGVNCSDRGITYFIDNPNCCDLVYDCTSAVDAKRNAIFFKAQGVIVIDLTPAKVGILCVPCINVEEARKHGNINMITCSGQAMLPLLHFVSQMTSGMVYVEAVSQIASSSAGMATRLNIDDYMTTTEAAIEHFTGVNNCKVILNLNPAKPEVDMQTTVYVKYGCINFNLAELTDGMHAKVRELLQYIPGYSLVLEPMIKGTSILIFSVRVRGCGDFLPEFAGNLDVINCAAIEVTKRIVDLDPRWK